MSSSEDSPYKTPKKTKVKKGKTIAKKINEEISSNLNQIIDNIEQHNNNQNDEAMEIDNNNDENNDSSLSVSSDNSSSLTTNEEKQNDNYGDLESILKEFQQVQSDVIPNTSLNASNVTGIDICKVYLILSATVKVLTAFTVSNAYGCRFYFNDTINNPNKLMYYTYITQLLNDTDNIKSSTDIGYLHHKNSRPVTIVSAYPKVQNTHCIETIQETYDKFVKFFENQPDPANIGKKFKFNYMADFNLNTYDRKKAFVVVTSKITLPDRLSLSGQLQMDSLNK